MKILDLKPVSANRIWIDQISEILTEEFGKPHGNSWEEEIQQSFERDRISRVVIMEQTDLVLGWIGGISQYGGKVWEIHPLVVRKEYRHRKIGSALIKDFEVQVKNLGGLTIWLGTDDDQGKTSLSGVNLYHGLWHHIKNIKNYKNHPFEFYQKMGFTIIGVMPDANGIGKPDILMAKKVE